MPFSEQELKQHIKEGTALPVYVLYGEETYLTSHFTEQLIRLAGVRPSDGLAEFNLQRFDGQECSFDAVEEAAEALPLMSDRKCVVVTDMDVTTASVFDRALALVSDPPEDTVLIFRMMRLLSDGKINARWKQFLEEAGRHGMVVELPRKSTEEIVRLLVSGAGRRGCTLRNDVARSLIEQCGNDLQLLLNELDKLCAVAANGEITPTVLAEVATKNLNAQVFELSNAILQNRYDHAYTLLHKLFSGRQEPIVILAALSGTYTDLYRAKLAAIGGQRAETLVEEFDYRGKTFRLKYASRDCSKLSLESLRESLDILAQADRRLKSFSGDKRVVLEETAAKLIITAKLGKVT